MKNLRILILILINGGILWSNVVNAQSTVQNPTEYLKGTWLRKVNTVTPLPNDLSWKDKTSVVEFKRTLNGNGLHQISYEGTREDEVYYFFDAAVQKLYGMKVDANGYVWQTEMQVNEDGSFGEIIGEALNDKQPKETIQLTKVSENEMTFTYKVYKNKKVALTAEGIFLRIPKY